MKYVMITKDSASTYEVRYMEAPSVVLKVIGGVFEHDLPKFIRDRFDADESPTPSGREEKNK